MSPMSIFSIFIGAVPYCIIDTIIGYTVQQAFNFLTFFQQQAHECTYIHRYTCIWEHYCLYVHAWSRRQNSVVFLTLKRSYNTN
jgi:hypothetical protein